MSRTLHHAVEKNILALSIFSQIKAFRKLTKVFVRIQDGLAENTIGHQHHQHQPNRIIMQN